MGDSTEKCPTISFPSYGELSDNQKLCFRHLGHFREDPEIEPEKLCHLWTMEGLILPQDCKTNMTLLDLTQDHLTGLTLKNFNSNLCEIRNLFKLSKLRDLNAKVEESLEDLKSITELMKTDEQKQQHCDAR